MILLITRYNLSPKWVQLILFLIFYFICLNLHYIDYTLLECMPNITYFQVLNSPTIFDHYEHAALLNHTHPTDRLFIGGVFRRSINSQDGTAFREYLKTLDSFDQEMKNYLLDLKSQYYNEHTSIEGFIGTGHCTTKYYAKATEIQAIHDKIGPYVEHVIECKKNYERLLQRSNDLEQTIVSLENKQKSYQETIQRMQTQNMSKIKNMIYEFLPLREENHLLQKRINDLEAQKFSLELKNKQLIHNTKELNQQILTKDAFIRELQTTKETISSPIDVTQQLQELRINLQKFEEHLNTQEANIQYRPNIHTEINSILNSCTTS